MTIIAALLLFGVIILIHEFGHFIFAKKNGITVHEFSIGMGPKLFGKEKNGTMYSIRILPIGGYVSMEGEDEESNKPGSFGTKSILQRASVIFAGPFFNLVLAVIFLIPVFIYMGSPTTTLEILDNSPASKVNLQTGDIVKSVNGKDINSWNEFTKIISSSKGEELSIAVDRNNKTVKVNVMPEKNKDGTYKIGVTYKKDKSIISAIKQSFIQTGQITIQMINFLKQMITGTVPGGFTNSVAGPVGVISIVSGAAKTGIMNLLYLGSIISLNLAIINLVPFPALDGGRLLLLFIEWIRGGKKINPDKEAMINMIGFCALMAFMVFITYNDVTKLFKGVIKF
ncbi:RIP metalloprotease RseP [Terrisporobacter petrolearius]|uniref:RIP metalloprotease RseP n=1 Tax=Terrisporobacter petrolearius TaxID=1460447 RepID=UPI001D16645A|nr:RIP metalloprotease RseP [Terrisporobacter petrolearius]MCC3864669.1 RIP metalloprotease RseP [Terrisporobacter petrolearius]